MKRRDPSRQLEFLLTELARLQIRVYNREFRATGLNQSQVSALVHLDRIEALSQTDLADRIGIRKAATGTLIEGLEGKNLIERTRSPIDRRLQLVSITKAGRRIVAEIDGMARDLGSRYRQGISRPDRAKLVSILRTLRRNLKAMDVEERDEEPE